MGKHRLQEELESLVREDGTIFEFLQAGSLDGIWYWDLENPEQEWMSERFWELLGVQPSEKKHLASEWQDLIFHEEGRKLVRSVRVVSGPLPAVLGNLTQLNQVFQQLLDNSLKFSSAECDEIEVKVSAEVKGNMVRVSVQDQGPGFPPTQSESIFELFRQGRGSADTEGEGGGLAIVKQIVRRHGGTVHAVSAQGAGTEVSFTLEAPGTQGGDSPTRRLS